MRQNHHLKVTWSIMVFSPLKGDAVNEGDDKDDESGTVTCTSWKKRSKIWMINWGISKRTWQMQKESLENCKVRVEPIYGSHTTTSKITSIAGSNHRSARGGKPTYMDKSRLARQTQPTCKCGGPVSNNFNVFRDPYNTQNTLFSTPKPNSHHQLAINLTNRCTTPKFIFRCTTPKLTFYASTVTCLKYVISKSSTSP